MPVEGEESSGLATGAGSDGGAFDEGDVDCEVPRASQTCEEEGGRGADNAAADNGDRATRGRHGEAQGGGGTGGRDEVGAGGRVILLDRVLRLTGTGCYECS